MLVVRALALLALLVVPTGHDMRALALLRNGN
jgi:hypothetical protein